MPINTALFTPRNFVIIGLIALVAALLFARITRAVQAKAAS